MADLPWAAASRRNPVCQWRPRLVAGAICVFYNGVHSAIVVFPLLIVYAGWAISLRAAAVFTGLTVAFLIGLVGRRSAKQFLPPPPPTPLAVFPWSRSLMSWSR
ncbi:MAG: hypothetical protein IPL72_13145 [Sulfuritalea sp.]|nr:hypothetical protein [Sulfuritalea sp.]